MVSHPEPRALEVTFQAERKFVREAEHPLLASSLNSPAGHEKVSDPAWTERCHVGGKSGSLVLAERDLLCGVAIICATDLSGFSSILMCNQA